MAESSSCTDYMVLKAKNIYRFAPYRESLQTLPVENKDLY